MVLSVLVIKLGRRLWQGILGVALTIFVSLSPSVAAQFTGEVVGVIDGDTIEVMRVGIVQKVRLYGIDCPEKKQAFGMKAKLFTSHLVFGKIVVINEKTTDRYGRTVGVVTLSDATILNEELVKAGLAWWYERYARMDLKLKALEQEARSNKRGLWVDANPIPPWKFRVRRK